MLSPLDSQISPPDQQRRFLIAVGTADYARLGADFQLPSVKDDLALIVECFTGSALGYKRVLSEVSLNPTVNPPADASPTFRQTLRTWFTSTKRTREDKVVFYYSGHGESDDSGEDKHYLLFNDSTEDLVGTALAVEELVRFMLSGSQVQHMLMILDTCYAGKGILNASVVVGKLTQGWDSAKDHGVFFVAAARAKEQAAEGVFARAFTEAVSNWDYRLGGKTQQYLSIDRIVGVLKEDFLRRHLPQQVTSSSMDVAAKEDFILNPQFDRSIPSDLDLESQRIALWHRDEMQTSWEPSARGTPEVGADVWYFTGRDEVLRQLVQWLVAETSNGKARVVTGGKGTGKSALLAFLVLLSDPAYRQRIEQAGALAGISPDTLPPIGAIDVKVYVRGKTLREVVRAIAAYVPIPKLGQGIGMGGHDAVTDARLLVRALAQRQQRLGLVVDALDEAAEPPLIAHELLKPLTGLPHVRLLVGSRPDTSPHSSGLRVQHLGSNIVEFDLDQPQYLGQDDIARYVERRLLAVQELGLRTPYRDHPDLARTVAKAVAKQAGTVFLLAQIISKTLREAEAPIDVRIPDWHRQFATDINEAFDADFDRFNDLRRKGLDKQKVKDLLMPLAYAEGAGLPWDDLWIRLVRSLSGHNGYEDRDITLLREHAGGFIVEGREHGNSVYRLYHEALGEYLRDSARDRENQRRIIETLIDLVPRAADMHQVNWRTAHPYIRTHIAKHAAKAGNGKLDTLVADPLFLVAADPEGLLPALYAVRSAEGLEASDIYHLAYDRLQPNIDALNAAYLHLAARQYGANHLADLLGALPLGLPWRIPWAHWLKLPAHRIISQRDALVSAIAVAKLDDVPHVVSVWTDGNGTVRVWNLATGRLYATFDKPLIWTLTVAEIDDVPHVVSGWMDGTVQIWNLITGDIYAEIPHAHKGRINAIVIAYLDKQPLIVSGGDDGALRVWMLADDQPFREIPKAHLDEISAVAIAHINGAPHIVSGGKDGAIRIWDLADLADLATGRPSVEIPDAHDRGVDAVAVAELEMQSLVVSGGSDGCIRTWDLTTGLPDLEIPNAHVESIKAVAVVELEKQYCIVSGSGDGLGVWNLTTGDPFGPWLTWHANDYSHFVGVMAVAVTELDRQHIAISGAMDGSVRVWDLDQVSLNTTADGSLEDQDSIHGVNVVALTELNNVSYIVTGEQDGAVRIWALASGQRYNEILKVHEGEITALAATDINGVPYVISGGVDGAVRVWNLASGQRYNEIPQASEGKYEFEKKVTVLAVTYINGVLYVISGSEFGPMRVWDLTSRPPREVRLTEEQKYSVNALTVTELEGLPHVVSAGRSGVVRVWDLVHRKPRGAMTLDEQSGHAIAIVKLKDEPHLVSVAVGSTRDPIIDVINLITTQRRKIKIIETKPQGLPIVDQEGGRLGIGVQAVVAAKWKTRPIVILGYREGKILFVDLINSRPILKLEIKTSIRSLAVVSPCRVIIGTDLGLVLLEPDLDAASLAIERRLADP